MQYNYQDYLRTVENFPKEGIVFQDIAPLVGNGAVFHALIKDMRELVDPEVTKIAGFDARGFVFGAALAHEMGLGLVMLRKPGKLPGNTMSASFDLEYGSAELELQEGVLGEEDTVLLVDDVIATGGTALAGIDLVRRSGAGVSAFLSVIDLLELGGSKKITGAGVVVNSMVQIGAN